MDVSEISGPQGCWNECGALDKTCPPKVNATRPPMEWQTDDIEYEATVWKGNGRRGSLLTDLCNIVG